MIEFESVGKTFRDGTAAVVDLSLTVPSGQITVIVGPSGCGKTTTLRMVNRMLEPSSGRILWDGNPLKSKRKTALRRQMGYVIQSGGLFPHRTVVENIGTVPGLLGWNRDKTQKRAMELLASVGLDRKLANRYPAQLSGGQQQRVGVARALAADPLVLLMDEPFSAVDPVVRSELHEFFLGLQREISKTIILITHDIDEAIKLGDRVAILRVGGRLAQVGTPQQLLDEPADAFVDGFIGRDRGYRSLSFLPAAGLGLERVAVVREVSAAKGADEPTLVIDSDARPVGWAHPDQPGRVFQLGSTFTPESDTLRTALDSALTSPYGLAVAVAPDTGRFAGVVPAAQILGQVADARSGTVAPVSVAEAVELRTEADADPEDTAAEPTDTEPTDAEPTDEPAVGGSTASAPVVDAEEDAPGHVTPEPAVSPADLEGDEPQARPEPADEPAARASESPDRPGAAEAPRERRGSSAAPFLTQAADPDDDPTDPGEATQASTETVRIERDSDRDPVR